MGHHRSRRPTSSDSGYDTNSDRPNSPKNDRKDHTSIESPKKSVNQRLRTHSVNARNASLLYSAIRTDLTTSIGTELSNVQLAKLNSEQLDELARLVSERGVVFFRNQDLTSEAQVRIFDHYGAAAGKHIVEKNQRFVKIKQSQNDHGENYTYAPHRRNDWQSDRSFEASPPSYSMVKADGAGPDAAWVSQYGLYDALSQHMKGFLDDLHAVHTSTIQYESIANLRGSPGHREKVETHHPAVTTHPVTGLKVLNVNPASVSGFAELTTKESKKLLELLDDHFDSVEEHTVHFTWEAGSVAIWDNRCTAHKTIPGFSTGVFRSFETVAGGKKPYLDSNSESRDERTYRITHVVEEERRTRARFNNTPLRRILRRQTNGPTDEEEEDEAYTSPQPTGKSLDGQTSKQFVLNSETLAQHEDQDESSSLGDPVIVVEKTENEKHGTSIRVEVSFRGSPLRRIIQRQASISK